MDYDNAVTGTENITLVATTLNYYETAVITMSVTPKEIVGLKIATPASAYARFYSLGWKMWEA